MLLSSLLALASLVAFARAHGNFLYVKIDDNLYKANHAELAYAPSPIRAVKSGFPMKGANNASQSCGLGSAAGAIIAPANPGSKVTFQWRDANPVNPWPHTIGPIMTWMAPCTGTTCDKFVSEDGEWFKIDQIGRVNASTNAWLLAETNDGKSVTVTLPSNVAPGQYLLRQEIIALHFGNKLGGAEWYPNCVQIQVGGTGTGKPVATTKFPGAYTDDEAGIYVPDIFQPNNVYTFPGLAPDPGLNTVGQTRITDTLMPGGYGVQSDTVPAPPAVAAGPAPSGSASTPSMPASTPSPHIKPSPHVAKPSMPLAEAPSATAAPSTSPAAPVKPYKAPPAVAAPTKTPPSCHQGSSMRRSRRSAHRRRRDRFRSAPLGPHAS